MLAAARLDRRDLVVSAASIPRLMNERGFLGPRPAPRAKTTTGCHRTDHRLKEQPGDNVPRASPPATAGNTEPARQRLGNGHDPFRRIEAMDGGDAARGGTRSERLPDLCIFAAQ